MDEEKKPVAATSDTAADSTAAEPAKRRKKSKKIVPKGHVHVRASYNNTIVTFTDQNGNVVSWCSAGSLGFKGPKKATPYVAGLVVRNASEKAQMAQMKEVDVFVRGVGAGREAAIRALPNNGFQILSIKDVTPVPHNGCRPRKIRRV